MTSRLFLLELQISIIFNYCHNYFNICIGKSYFLFFEGIYHLPVHIPDLILKTCGFFHDLLSLQCAKCTCRLSAPCNSNEKNKEFLYNFLIIFFRYLKFEKNLIIYQTLVKMYNFRFKSKMCKWSIALGIL